MVTKATKIIRALVADGYIQKETVITGNVWTSILESAEGLRIEVRLCNE